MFSGLIMKNVPSGIALVRVSEVDKFEKARWFYDLRDGFFDGFLGFASSYSSLVISIVLNSESS